VEWVIVMRWARLAMVTGVMWVVALAGCGSDEGGSAQGPSPVTVPTLAQLQDALLVPADLTGQWGVDDKGTQGGVIELCAAASDESKRAAADLEFQTGVKLREVTEPGATGAVYVAQFLLADQTDSVQAKFEALLSGSQACYGQPLVPEEDYGTNEPYEVPAVGDARYGEYHVMGSDVPGFGTYLHMAVERDGPVLMLLNVWEFTGQEGQGPEISTQDVGTIVTTAANKLP
jgi:hypothetical protein